MRYLRCHSGSTGDIARKSCRRRFVSGLGRTAGCSITDSRPFRRRRIASRFSAVWKCWPIECSGCRRECLRHGSFSTGSEGGACCFPLQNGGPSQFETFDPKPESLSETPRPLSGDFDFGPRNSIVRDVASTRPAMHQFSLIRTLWHDAAPFTEPGCRCCRRGVCPERGIVSPSLASIVTRHLRGSQRGLRSVCVATSCERQPPLDRFPDCRGSGLLWIQSFRPGLFPGSSACGTGKPIHYRQYV